MQTKPLQEVWPGVEASSWCVVWVAPITAGMNEDTQRELFLEEKRSNKELGAHAREIPRVPGRKCVLGAEVLKVRRAVRGVII